MAQLYRFTDENGQTRLMAEISPAPGGGLPAEWTVGADGSLLITSTAAGSDFANLVEFAASDASPWALITSGDGHHRFNQDGSNFIWAQIGGDRPGNIMRVREYDVILYNQAGNDHLFKTDRDNDGVGFYGHAAAAQQTLTSGTATPEQIALALQANGFCGGT